MKVKDDKAAGQAYECQRSDSLGYDDARHGLEFVLYVIL